MAHFVAASSAINGGEHWIDVPVPAGTEDGDVVFLAVNAFDSNGSDTFRSVVQPNGFASLGGVGRGLVWHTNLSVGQIMGEPPAAVRAAYYLSGGATMCGAMVSVRGLGITRWTQVTGTGGAGNPVTQTIAGRAAPANALPGFVVTAWGWAALSSFAQPSLSGPSQNGETQRITVHNQAGASFGIMLSTIDNVTSAPADDQLTVNAGTNIFTSANSVTLTSLIEEAAPPSLRAGWGILVPA